jgi:predicted MFS family arabinose efflux permease
MAIAIAAFTVAGAVGAPLGAAIALVAGWRFAMTVAASIGVLMAIAILIVGQGLPAEPAITIGRRIRAIGNPRLATVLRPSGHRFPGTPGTWRR